MAWRTRGDKGDLKYYLQLVDRTPETAQVHGMYLLQIYDVLHARGIQVEPDASLRRFRYYSLRDFMELCLDAALTLYPDEPLRSALQRLGRMVIPTFFESSMLGKVLLGIAGSNWETALNCVTRGYQISLKPGKATVTRLDRGRAVVELRDIWSFGDSYQVGIIESLMEWYHVEGEVVASVLSSCNTDINVNWSTAR
jgi:uncharacterized protein (TIGR02265 family)